MRGLHFERLKHLCAFCTGVLCALSSFLTSSALKRFLTALPWYVLQSLLFMCSVHSHWTGTLMMQPHLHALSALLSHPIRKNCCQVHSSGLPHTCFCSQGQSYLSCWTPHITGTGTSCRQTDQLVLLLDTTAARQQADADVLLKCKLRRSRTVRRSSWM